MIVLLVFLAQVAAFFFGMFCMLGAVKKISPEAYRVLYQELKWRKAERKAWKDDEFTRR